MVTASLLSGRSRHGSSRSSMRAHRTKTTPRHRTPKPAEDEVAPKPDLDELRRRRLAYLSVSPEQRRRVSTAVEESKPLSRSSTLSSRKPSSEHRRRRRKHHASSSTKTDKSSSAGRSSRNDYVYGPAPSRSHSSRSEDDGRHKPDSRRRSTHSSSSTRRSLPTVVESDEVTPDDSISQIGENSRRGSSRLSSNSRSTLKRASTSSAKLAAINEQGEELAREHRSRRTSKRDSTPSLISSLMRRNTEPAIPTEPKLVECLTCASDDVPSHKSVKLTCGHRMCHDCLKHVFTMSVKDPAMMPPKCCTNDHIPLKHVEKLFDLKFKMLWNRKYQEYHTKNRIYCPAPKCGEWIKPSHIHSHHGRKYAQCPRCATKVCISCNGKMHKSRECPKDPEIAKLVEQAKEKGWQTCHSCHAMVELKEGCNHMTCRCMAEFCMICGAKWKTCDCPWFNYNQTPDADRLNEWRIPEPIQIIYRAAFGARNPGQPVPPPRDEHPRADDRRRQPTYTEELDERRRQERSDADLARRMQLASLLEPEENTGQARRRAEVEAWGLGNAGGHFMNDDFVQTAANVVMSAFGDAAMGRRGDRASGRRRRARQADEADAGLARNFLGDESVLGVEPARTRPSR